MRQKKDIILRIIGFDGKRAAQNRTGLGNYSRFVVGAIAHFAPQLRLFVYAPNPKKAYALGDLSAMPNVWMRYPRKTLWKMFRSLWRVWGITKKLKAERVQLYHGLSNELPLNLHLTKKIKTVVTIHDLIFLRYPQYYKPVSRWIYHYKFRHACKKADRVIAVSECTKRDIMHFFETPEEKIEVIYQGCDEHFRQPSSDNHKNIVRHHYHLPKRYILYVGSIEERKNLMLIAKALPLLKDESIELVVVGRATSYLKSVKSFLNKQGCLERVHFRHNVVFGDLPIIYQMASAFIYPSRFEGFGIPMLEALCSGTPAIGCTGSCLEEAGGPSSLYVDPDDEKGLAETIDRVLSDDALRERMIADGHEYAKRFEEEKLAQEMVDLYQRVLNED